jgi:hypothetical protein
VAVERLLVKAKDFSTILFTNVICVPFLAMTAQPHSYEPSEAFSVSDGSYYLAIALITNC